MRVSRGAAGAAFILTGAAVAAAAALAYRAARDDESVTALACKAGGAALATTGGDGVLPPHVHSSGESVIQPPITENPSAASPDQQPEEPPKEDCASGPREDANDKRQESNRDGESLAWLGLGPAAVTVALIIGLLVDSGVFAEITASASVEKVLWATARLFGFLVVAVAVHSTLVRIRTLDWGTARSWRDRRFTQPGVVGTVISLPFLLATPFFWLLFNLLCWGLFLVIRYSKGRLRSRAVLASAIAVVLVSLTVVVTSVAPSRIPQSLNPARMLVGRVVASLPRSVVFVREDVSVSDGGAGPATDSVKVDRQVGYVLDASATELIMLESYPPRVWVIDANSVVARVPCVYEAPWFQMSPLDMAAGWWGQTRTTLACDKVVETDAGHDPRVKNDHVGPCSWLGPPGMRIATARTSQWSG